MKSLCVIMAIAFAMGLLTPVCFAEDTAAQKVLREGIMGAAVGGIAASASGGKAGKGALIGAGTNIAGNVIMDALSGPSQPAQPQQVQTVPVQQYPVQQYPVQQYPVASTPSLYQQGYNEGYAKGFDAGYEKGYAAGMAATRR